jgi:hypothetical protein
MAAPPRGNTGFCTYFITAATFQKHSLFQSDRMAGLFVQVLLSYRSQHKYPYSSASAGMALDAAPRRLKPSDSAV